LDQPKAERIGALSPPKPALPPEGAAAPAAWQSQLRYNGCLMCSNPALIRSIADPAATSAAPVFTQITKTTTIKG